MAPLPTSLPVRMTTAPADAAHTYYIDPSIGSDSNTVTQARNPATPWATLNGALNAVPVPAAGSNTPVCIYIRGTDGVTTRGFTITDTGPGSACPASFQSTAIYIPPARISFPADSPLTISNYPGERVLIGFPIRFNYTARYVRIAGTRVNGKKGIVLDQRFPAGGLANSGFQSNGSQHCELYGIEIRNNCWQGLGGGVGANQWNFNGIDQPTLDLQIWNCFIHHNGGATTGGHGLYWGATSGGLLIGAVGGGVINCVIAWNQDDNLDPHNMADGSVFAHNTIVGWGGGGSAVGVVSPVPLTGTGVNRAFSNGVTFFSSGNVSQPQSRNNMIVNNILAYNYAWGLQQYDPPTGGGNVEKNNLYFGNGSGARTDASGTWTFASTLTNANPQFASWSATNPASDLHPASTSPAKAAGDGAFTPSFDYDDNARSGSDIGAFTIGTVAGGGGGGGGSLVIGDSAQGATNDSGYANARAAMKVTVPAGGMTVSEIRCWLQIYSGAPTARAAIYADSSGVIGARMGVSADQVLTVNAVQQAVFPLSISLAPGDYWLAIGFTGGTPNVDLLASSGTHVYNLTDGTLPSSFGTPVTNGTYDMPISAHGVSNTPPPAVSRPKNMTLLGVA